MKFKNRKAIRSLFLFISVLPFLFSSCKNFLNGTDLLQELNDSINYLNLKYVEVSVVASNSYTESIIPAAGKYENKYKKGDVIELKFTPTSGFQFNGWGATPEGSITFEDDLSSATVATIINDEDPISIEPKVFERPTVSFEPANTFVQPKNIPISIIFSQPIVLTEDNINKIDISLGGVSIKEYYEDTPTVSDDKTTITFVPRRDKLIDIFTGVSIITVSVPASFYALQGDVQVSLAGDVIYAFKVNSDTATKATISFNCPTTQGDLSYSTSKSYNLDEKVTSTCTPKSEYRITDWEIYYAGEEKLPVEKGILKVNISDDKSTIAITVLVGVDKEIIVAPVFELIPAVIKYYPDTEVGTYSKDSVISILFNTKVDLSYFSTDTEPFLHTEILSKNKNDKSILKDYFFPPEMLDYENKSELIIKPRTEKIGELLGDNEFETITVKLILKEMKDINDEVIFSDNLSFSYKIDSKTKDTKAPEFVEDFKIFRSLEDAKSGKNAVLTSAVESGHSMADVTYCYKFAYGKNSEEKKYCQDNKYNMAIGKKVWLYAKIKDTDFNNLQKIVISERLMGSGYLSTRNYKTYSFPYTTTDDCITFNPENGEYTFLKEYTLSSEENGPLRLKMEVFDGSNATTQKVFDVFYITSLAEINGLRTPPAIKANTLSENIELYFYFDALSKSYNNGQDGGNVKAETYTFNMGALSTSEYANAGGNFIIHVDEVSYSYDNANFTKCSFDNDYIQSLIAGKKDTYYPCAKVTIPRDCTKNMYVKVKYSDIFGNKGEKLQTVPKNVDVIDASISGDAFNITLSDTAGYPLYLYYSKDNSDLITVTSFSGNTFSASVSDLLYFTGDGIYNFYVFPWEYNERTFTGNQYKYEETFRNNIFSYLATSFSEFKYFKNDSNSVFYLIPMSGSVGSSFSPVYVGTGSTKPDSTLVASDVPSTFTFTKTSNGINSASYSVKVDYPSGFSPNKNCVYLYEVNNITKSEKTTVLENPFTCKSGCEYEIKVIVKDKNGNQDASNPVSLQIPTDNISPSWDITAEGVVDFNHFNITSSPSSNNTLEDNKKIYYYIDNNKTATLDNFTTKSYTSYLEEGKYCIYLNG